MPISRVPHSLPLVAIFLASCAIGFADEETGATVFRNFCAACHGDDGRGVPGTYPPLEGSPFLKADPALATRIVLHGLEGPVTVGGQTFNAVMPAHGETLSDEEIADVLNHVRRSWGDGNTEEITSAKVGEIRGQDPERMHMWTIAELESLAPAAATASPPPQPQPQEALPPAPAPRPGWSPSVSAPVPWFRLALLATPVVAFLLGICLLPEGRR